MIKNKFYTDEYTHACDKNIIVKKKKEEKLIIFFNRYITKEEKHGNFSGHSFVSHARLVNDSFLNRAYI